MSRVETEDAASGVRVVAFNRPDVRNAFDTAMYDEVTAVLRAADADEAVGAVVVTGRGTAFTSGQDLAEMAAIATGTAVEGAGQGFMGLLDCLCDISVPLLAAVNGVAVGLGFTLLAHCDLVLVDAGAAAGALRRAGRARRGGEQPAVPRRHGLATGGPGPAHVSMGGGGGARRARPRPRGAPGGHGAGRDGRPGRGVAAHPRAATRAITTLMRAARRDAVQEANRREQAAYAALLGAAVGGGTLAESAARVPPGT